MSSKWYVAYMLEEQLFVIYYVNRIYIHGIFLKPGLL